MSITISEVVRKLLEIVNQLQQAYPKKKFTLDGRLVQIKATMKDALTFPADHVPDCYLGIKINKEGSFDEVFNGPGAIAWEAVKNRKPPKTNLHSISIQTMVALSRKVDAKERIPLRRTRDR